MGADDLELMRLIDEQYLRTPFYGARKMAVVLRRSGHHVGRKRVTRLMRVMGMEAIYRKPNLSRRHPQHKIYPYLLRNREIDRVHQVWSCDITYIPMAYGFMYLVAVIDWHSRVVLSWRMSNTMAPDFCVEALEEAFRRYGKTGNLQHGSRRAVHLRSLHRGACDARHPDQHGRQRSLPRQYFL